MHRGNTMRMYLRNNCPQKGNFYNVGRTHSYFNKRVLQLCFSFLVSMVLTWSFRQDRGAHSLEIFSRLHFFHNNFTLLSVGMLKGNVCNMLTGWGLSFVLHGQDISSVYAAKQRFTQEPTQVLKLCIRKGWRDSRDQVKAHIPSHPTDDLRKETGQTSNPVVSSYRTAVKTYSTNATMDGIRGRKKQITVP